MADSTSNYVIRLVVDNSAAKAGLTDTGAAAAALGPALDRGIGAGARAADVAIQMVDRDAQKAIKTIQDMSATIGMTPVQKLAYRADQLGVGDVVAPDISKLLDYEAAQRGVAASAQQAAGAVNAFGETEEQASARIRRVAADAVASQAALQGTARAAYDAAIANQSFAKSSSDSSTTVAQQNQAMRDYATLQARQNAQAQQLREGIKTGSGNFTELEAQYGRLDAAMAQGSLTAEEYENAFASLRKEEDNLTRSLDALRGRYDPVGVAQRRLAQDTKTLADAFKNGQLSEKEYQAALNGIQVDQANVSLAELGAQERALRQSFKDGAITAKEYKNGLAGIASSKVPFKAIVDGAKSAGEEVHGFNLKSASARSELVVLGHELLSGNWKNFGGSLMVLAERTDFMSIAMSGAGIAVGGVVAVIAAFAVAAVRGAQEQTKLANAIAATGNYAGVSEGQINTMAEQIGGATGRVGKAREVLEGLVASGRIGGDALQAVGTAAVALSDVTGESADKVAEQFSRMSSDVAKGAAEMNDQYHFLTPAIYDHIKALEDEGDHTGAMRVAAQALTNQLEAMKTPLGALPQFWRDLSAAMDEVGRKMLNLGKTTTVADIYANQKWQLAQYQESLQSAQQSGNTLAANLAKKAINEQLSKLAETQRELDLSGADAASQGNRNTAVSAAVDASRALDTMAESVNKAARRQRDLNKLTLDFKHLWNDPSDPSHQNSRLAGVSFDDKTQSFSGGLFNTLQTDILNRDKDRVGPKAKAPQDDAATRMLESLRQEAAAMQEQLDSSDKLTESAKKRAEFEQRIADIKNKPVLTAADKSYLGQESDLRAQLETNVALAKSVQLKQQEDQLTQRSAQINQQIADRQAVSAENYQRTLSAFGQGKDAQAQAQVMNQIALQSQKDLERLAKETPKNLLGSDQYKAEQAEIKGSMQRSLADATDYYAQLKQRQGDWTNGVSEAMADYQSTVANHSAQAETIFNDSMKSGEDVFVNFMKTGKLSVTSLADTFIEEVTRMEYRLLMSKLMSGGIAGSLGSGSWLGNLLGTTKIPTGAIDAANASDDPIGALATILPGSFDTGGFTGIGGKYDPAGVVHKGEFVFDKETTSKYRPLFEAIHAGHGMKSWRGYAEGGYVGGGKSGGFGISVPVNVVNEAGDVSHATAQQTMGPNGLPSIDVIVRRVQNGLAKNMRAGQGSLHSAISTRFGVRPKPGGAP